MPEMNESFSGCARSKVTSAPINEKNTKARFLKNIGIFCSVDATIEAGIGALRRNSNNNLSGNVDGSIVRGAHLHLERVDAALRREIGSIEFLVPGSSILTRPPSSWVLCGVRVQG
ncbi:MAG: hypothetical protein AB7D42_03230 [Candidatus Methanomethylophilaceae archaeon]